MEIEDRLYTMPEASKILKVSEWKAYEMARKGEIPTVKFGTGRLVRVSGAWLRRFVAGEDGKAA